MNLYTITTVCTGQRSHHHVVEARTLKSAVKKMLRHVTTTHRIQIFGSLVRDAGQERNLRQGPVLR